MGGRDFKLAPPRWPGGYHPGRSPRTPVRLTACPGVGWYHRGDSSARSMDQASSALETRDRCPPADLVACPGGVAQPGCGALGSTGPVGLVPTCLRPSTAFGVKLHPPGHLWGLCSQTAARCCPASPGLPGCVWPAAARPVSGEVYVPTRLPCPRFLLLPVSSSACSPWRGSVSLPAHSARWFPPRRPPSWGLQVCGVRPFT